MHSTVQLRRKKSLKRRFSQQYTLVSLLEGIVLSWVDQGIHGLILLNIGYQTARKDNTDHRDYNRLCKSGCFGKFHRLRQI